MVGIDSRLAAILGIATLLLPSLTGGALFASDGAGVTTATEKILATMRSAVDRSPEMAWRSARLGAEVAEARSHGGAGAPTLSWQREGIGGGLERRPNAADYLRVNVPFDPPWRRSAGKDLREATERLLEAGVAASRLEVAAVAGRRWLDLAAETEMAELAGRRTARVEKALATQTRRYELGEISGSERTQLELQLARERTLLQQSEIRRLTAEQQLLALTSGSVPMPVSGDLGRLVDSTTSAGQGGASPEAALDEVPFLLLAAARGDVAVADGKNQRRRAWGQPEVELEWARIPDLGPLQGFDAAGIRIVFPLPLGGQGRQKILATESRAAASAAERESLHRQLAARLHAALQTADAAEAALESLQATADQISFSEHSLAEQFRLGAVSYLVYLDGLSRLDEVRRGLIETRYTLLAARLELAQLLGADSFFPLPQLHMEGS